jgi:sugar/nucleoside kinase (ribokinase family)
MRLDVVGLGFSCIDDLLLLTEIPGPEGRASLRQRKREGGGMAATAMAAVARLDGRAGFVAKVGDDPIGGQILDEFRRFGVDVSRAVIHPGATSHRTIVLVDQRSGARAFISDRGTVVELQPEELDRDYVTSAPVLHVSDATPAAIQAARWAREAGRRVSFDGTHFHPAVFGLLQYVDLLVVSRFFASEFVAHQEGRDLGSAAQDFARFVAGTVGTADHRRAEIGDHQSPAGEPRTPLPPPPVAHGSGRAEGPLLQGEQLLDAARRLQGLGIPLVVITEGEHGSWCTGEAGSFHVPAYPVQVVDTTGAGDVFHGAFALGCARGWDLRRALAIASAAAALKCRALGGRSGIPSLAEAEALVDG